MKVELELAIEEEDESVVMDKISEITRYAKEQGFQVEEIEIKREKDDKESEEHHKRKAVKRKSVKRKRSS